MSTGVDAQVMASSRPEADVEGAEWTWQCLGPVIDGRALIVRFSPNGKRALVRGSREGGEWTWQCLGPVIDGRALIVRFSPNGKRALVRGSREGGEWTGQCLGPVID